MTVKIMRDITTQQVLNIGQPPWANQGELTNYEIVDCNIPVPEKWWKYNFTGSAFILAGYVSPWEQAEINAAAAIEGWRNLPDWATWTPQQAQDNITSAVLAGQTRVQVDAWIDANTTGTTLATLKPQLITALKLLAGAIIDTRTILAIVGKCIVYLRDVAIRRL